MARVDERPGPGEGRIRMALPIARLLDGCGVGAEAFIALVRSGELDMPRRPYRFTGGDEGVHERMRLERGRDIPETLPRCEGAVTWRRADQVSRVDFKVVHVTPGAHWNEMRQRGKPPGALTIIGVELTQSLLIAAPGRPLRDYVDHPAFADEQVVIVEASSRASYTFNAHTYPSTTIFELEFPDAEYDDPGNPQEN